MDLPAACGGTLGVWLPSESGVRGALGLGTSRQPSLREIERELAAVGGPDEVAAVVERYRRAGCTVPALLAVDGTMEEGVVHVVPRGAQ